MIFMYMLYIHIRHAAINDYIYGSINAFVVGHEAQHSLYQLLITFDKCGLQQADNARPGGKYWKTHHKTQKRKI